MQTDKEADPEVQRGFDEDYEMAGKLKGVDVIFGMVTRIMDDQACCSPKNRHSYRLNLWSRHAPWLHKIYCRAEKHNVKFLGGKLILLSQPNSNATMQLTR